MLRVYGNGRSDPSLSSGTQRAVAELPAISTDLGRRDPFPLPPEDLVPAPVLAGIGDECNDEILLRDSLNLIDANLTCRAAIVRRIFDVKLVPFKPKPSWAGQLPDDDGAIRSSLSQGELSLSSLPHADQVLDSS